ncbi:MAG TPA: phosphotransferase family protein [Acidimicrobiia bacterium]|nr:phosphotransferase family protein [Acidimicrobiia bacterium]
MSGTSPPGVDLDAFTAWAGAALPQLQPPFTGTFIAGGRSNITVRITDATGADYVVRRPPLHSVLATAHDVAREHRIISALGPTPVPVPRTLAVCDDVDVLGAPFYVMEYVDGIVLNTAEVAVAELNVDARAAAGPSLVDAQVALHAVDPDAVGLGTLAKKEDFIARQLHRWSGQWAQTKQREVPAVDRVHRILSENIPEQRESRIVHGDFRLGNCIVDTDGHVRAVLDWELCTLGDPLADVGYMLASWPRPDDTHSWDLENPTTAPGFVEHADLIERYAAESGRDLGDIDFYVAFSYWRLACILEGVYARSLGGAQGESDVDPEEFRIRVDNCAALADERAAGLVTGSGSGH